MFDVVSEMILPIEAPKTFFVCSMEELGYLIADAIVYGENKNKEQAKKLLDSKDKCLIREITAEVVEQFYTRPEE